MLCVILLAPLSTLTMTIRPFFYFTALLLTQSIYGQLSLTSPLICHDKDNYLRCYNDGNYILTFGNGNFKEFKTSDNTLKYSDVDKTITFIQKSRLYNSLIVDTIQIIQHPKSILMKKGTASLEITSLKEIPKEINDYGIGPYSIDNIVRGFTFWAGDRYIKLEVWTYGKSWSWNIVAEEKAQRFAVQYNSYRSNRIEHIIMQDDTLKYGFVISMTFKTLKKINRFIAFYAQLENRTSATSYSIIPLDKSYKYEYNKGGRLKSDKVIGELKFCDCN